MFYIIGFLRRTPLFGLMALPISIFVFDAKLSTVFRCLNNVFSISEAFAAFLFWSIIFYPVFAALHLIMVKISHKNRDLCEAYFSALGADLTAPFRYVGLFLAVVLGKHKIKDDSFFHDAEDFIQVLFGFVWTVLMVVFFAIGFLNIGSL